MLGSVTSLVIPPISCSADETCRSLLSWMLCFLPGPVHRNFIALYIPLYLSYALIILVCLDYWIIITSTIVKLALFFPRICWFKMRITKISSNWIQGSSLSNDRGSRHICSGVNIFHPSTSLPVSPFPPPFFPDPYFCPPWWVSALSLLISPPLIFWLLPYPSLPNVFWTLQLTLSTQAFSLALSPAWNSLPMHISLFSSLFF